MINLYKRHNLNAIILYKMYKLYLASLECIQACRFSSSLLTNLLSQWLGTKLNCNNSDYETERIKGTMSWNIPQIDIQQHWSGFDFRGILQNSAVLKCKKNCCPKNHETNWVCIISNISWNLFFIKKKLYLLKKKTLFTRKENFIY